MKKARTIRTLNRCGIQDDQFAALAALMRLSIETPRGRALRAVLCDGVSVPAAAREEGIAHQPVYRAVESAKRTLALASAVSAPPPPSQASLPFIVGGCLRGSAPACHLKKR